jgi:hypothetical protein
MNDLKFFFNKKYDGNCPSSRCQLIKSSTEESRFTFSRSNIFHISKVSILVELIFEDGRKTVVQETIITVKTKISLKFLNNIMRMLIYNKHDCIDYDLIVHTI